MAYTHTPKTDGDTLEATEWNTAGAALAAATNVTDTLPDRVTTVEGRVTTLENKPPTGGGTVPTGGWVNAILEPGIDATLMPRFRQDGDLVHFVAGKCVNNTGNALSGGTHYCRIPDGITPPFEAAQVNALRIDQQGRVFPTGNISNTQPVPAYGGGLVITWLTTAP